MGKEQFPARRNEIGTSEKFRFSPPVQLKRAITEYKLSKPGVESERKYQQKKWNIFGNLLEKTVDVRLPNITNEKLIDFRHKGLTFNYNPPEITVDDLSEIHRTMGWGIIKITPRIEESNEKGWFASGRSIISPNRNTTQEQLENIFKKEGFEGMGVTSYIIASQDSKAKYGRFLDEKNTSTRLLGASYDRNLSLKEDNHPVSPVAWFSPNGSLHLSFGFKTQDHFEDVGGRYQIPFNVKKLT